MPRYLWTIDEDCIRFRSYWAISPWVLPTMNCLLKKRNETISRISKSKKKLLLIIWRVNQTDGRDWISFEFNIVNRSTSSGLWIVETNLFRKNFFFQIFPKKNQIELDDVRSSLNNDFFRRWIENRWPKPVDEAGIDLVEPFRLRKEILNFKQIVFYFSERFLREK